MPKQETLVPQRSKIFAWTGNVLFYGAILIMIAFAELPPVGPQNFRSRDELFSGNEKIFVEPGSQFEPFKPYLPVKGAVSFVMDTPYHPYSPKTESLYMAQSYLAPLVLSVIPVEPTALVYCSKGFIADQWMQNTGYRLKLALTDGQGIAEKI
jgi:hypothetical protein